MNHPCVRASRAQTTRAPALRAAASAALLALGACASHPSAEALMPAPAVAPGAPADAAQGPSPAEASPPAAVACEGCASLPMAPDLAAALKARIGELKARGGDCAAYGEVLEEALVSGRIVVRPYMWRVRGNLASAEGESSGEMTLARDIDSLNVGVRTLDEVTRSAEHEAVHIAMRIASGDEAREARVQERVNECRGTGRP